ncbi:MAG: putative selenium-dependent hydroxylase accessory protein YqeC, partial [Anaerolineaceae bacterium]|nr:putative selenium-dependent hydroxylase accessory protein YqeC [Anaerolineaceae bacterium]
SREEFTRLAGICKAEGFTLITESDGAAQKHLKAPAAHEPVHPAESDICIYLIGMDILGEPAGSKTVHRPELFARITGSEEGEPVNADHLIHLLEHPDGGLKGMPAGAVKIVHLTHVDSRERMKTAEYIAERLHSYQYLTYYK